MKYCVVLFAVFSTSTIEGNVMTLAKPAPAHCKPANEADIARDDPLVNHVFDVDIHGIKIIVR